MKFLKMFLKNLLMMFGVIFLGIIVVLAPLWLIDRFVPHEFFELGFAGVILISVALFVTLVSYDDLKDE